MLVVPEKHMVCGGQYPITATTDNTSDLHPAGQQGFANCKLQVQKKIIIALSMEFIHILWPAQRMSK